MLIKNWMKDDPVTIPSDLTAKEAMDFFEKYKVRFIPVVDNGKLRGILVRSDLREAASFVTASQSIHEVNFFNTRLKVKDLMVRYPVTLSITDTFESALKKGAELRRRFFPVMDGGQLVGTISDVDIFNSLYQILNVDEDYAGMTIDSEQLGEKAIKYLVDEIDALGGQVQCLFTINQHKFKRIIVRLSTNSLQTIYNELQQKGYNILEMHPGGAVSPMDIERKISKHPSVKECAIIEPPDSEEFNHLLVYVVLNKEYEKSEELKKELEYIVRENASSDTSVGIRIIDNLPKTATGKIQKYMLQVQPPEE